MRTTVILSLAGEEMEWTAEKKRLDGQRLRAPSRRRLSFLLASAGPAFTVEKSSNRQLALTDISDIHSVLTQHTCHFMFMYMIRPLALSHKRSLGRRSWLHTSKRLR